jgi:hypothetical protein
LKLIGEITREIDLGGSLDVEQRLAVVLDAQACDLERIDQLLGNELEACGSDVAGEGAVGVLLHLVGVDLHDCEKPLLLDIEVERGLVATVAVLVVLEP